MADLYPDVVVKMSYAAFHVIAMFFVIPQCRQAKY